MVYVRPGDEHYPTYHHPDVRRLVANATSWAASEGSLSSTRRWLKTARPYIAPSNTSTRQGPRSSLAAFVRRDFAQLDVLEICGPMPSTTPASCTSVTVGTYVTGELAETAAEFLREHDFDDDDVIVEKITHGAWQVQVPWAMSQRAARVLRPREQWAMQSHL